MNFKQSSARPILLWLCLSLYCGPVWAQVWDNAYVLLGNDQVLTGRIEQLGNAYRIRQNEGNEIQVARQQVAFIGPSIQSLYEHKVKSLPQYARSGDYARLARWCLRAGMLAEAGEQYLILASSHSADSNPSVRQLGEEIKNQMLEQDDFRIALGLRPLNSQTAGTQMVDLQDNRSPAVVTASAGDNSLEIPLPIQSRFNEQVQHILINRCGQAACHGHATATGFQLLELTGRDATARSRSNLNSTLQFVSRDPLAKSKLIEYLSTSHGGMSSPPIGRRESNLLAEVVNWTRWIQNPVLSAEATNQSTSLNPLNPAAPQLRQVPRVPSADFGNNAVGVPTEADMPSMAELDELDAQVRQLDRPSAASDSSTIDPFDPAEFNRQTAAMRP